MNEVEVTDVVENPPRLVPQSWNCMMEDGAKGQFAVLEVEYSKPKKRGISVAQVWIQKMFCGICGVCGC